MLYLLPKKLYCHKYGSLERSFVNQQVLLPQGEVEGSQARKSHLCFPEDSQ